MRSVFVSYRRGDSEGQARALNSELVKVIGKDSVFMDVDSIALGQDFRRILHDRLESCELMLVLIGPNWLDAKDTSGSRRLDSATDLVRQEIAAALKRNIPVTPVLLQGTQMPAPDRLPDDIKELVYRNGFELGHSTWESDVSEMVKRLGLDKQSPAAPRQAEGVVANSGRLAALPKAFKTPWVLATFVIAIMAAVLFYRNTADLSSNDDIGDSIQQPTVSSSQQAARPTADGRAESSPQQSAQAPTGKLTGLGTIKIANLKTRAVEVYEQSSDGSTYLSAGYAGTITPPDTSLQVPAGTYKLKIGRVFVEHLHVTSANPINILFGTISVPGLSRETEVYEQSSDGSTYLSAGYAGTITPPETTLQVPAGTYKLKFARMFVQPVRVEADRTVIAQ